ncbi:MAG TPA: FAD-dependent oxidoreductase [Actinomycetota bacterium]|jgi:glycerol-3-phosphate dehydrogenase|nr:FAD-dependent oxidoreductase [Actinomycetota bacterium]
MTAARVVIVGGGGTGGALAHDLALRGVKVTLVERAEFTSGTTGRHHGLLHSGARYAVNDAESAVECIEENRILRRIVPGSFEENDGLFVAVTDEDMDFLPSFLRGCEASGIPADQLAPAEALRLEPNLNPSLKAAVRVPDATMDAMRMPLRFFATARANGAELLNHVEVTGLLSGGGAVRGVAVLDHVSGREAEIGADLVVNATGPWSEKIARMGGVDVPIRPSPGVMLAVRGRLCNMVLNRLHPSGDGDIVVPQRALSIVGTSSWVVEDPEELEVPEDHVRRMWEEGEKLIPMIRNTPFRAAWSAARPLIGPREADASRELSRTFKTIDHAEEGVEGFVTITGGKATTLRGMAEVCADVVCRKLGVDEPCRTRETLLLPHRAAFAA